MTPRHAAFAFVGLALAAGGIISLIWLGALAGGSREHRDTLSAPTQASEPPVFDLEREEILWRRHLAEGGQLELQARDPKSDAVVQSLKMVGLGPLPPADRDIVSGRVIEELAYFRKLFDESRSKDLHEVDRTIEESNFLVSEQRMLAHLDLLAKDEYWVFSTEEERSAAERLIKKASYTTRAGAGSSQDKHLLLPVFRDAYPLYYDAIESAKIRVRSVLQPLVLEFNQLPESQRRLIHDLRWRKGEWPQNDPSLLRILQRFAARGLVIDPVTLVGSASIYN
ncbi:MAG: hypothetical protein JNM84_19810 [Planctomycetes bacterium]|nr:hypothetical protein [Planctomycetota bacterium]